MSTKLIELFSEPEKSEKTTQSRILELAVDSIVPNPKNPRKNFKPEALEELAQSIKEVGILQPVVVLHQGADIWRLIAGERRWRAAKLAGLSSVPAVVVAISPEQEVQVMLIENLQREDLDPIEEAHAYLSLTKEHGWKQQDLAKQLGVSQAHIANRIRLLKLPETLQENISAGIIPVSVAKDIVTFTTVPGVIEALKDDIEEQMEDYEEIDAMELKNTASWAAYNKTRPLFEGNAYGQKPEFDLEPCRECAQTVKLPGQNETTGKHLRCLNAECWDKKQEEARKRKQEDQMAKIQEDNPGVINSCDLEPGSFETFTTWNINFDTAECEGCEQKKAAINRWNEQCDTCLNPDCFKAKNASAKKERLRIQEEKKQAHEEKLKAILEGSMIWDKNLLVLIAARAIETCPYNNKSNTAQLKKEISEKFGWKKLKDAEGLVENLKTLTSEELQWVIVYAVLQPIEEGNQIFEAVYGD